MRPWTFIPLVAVLVVACGSPVSEQEMLNRSLIVPDLADRGEIQDFIRKLEYLDSQSPGMPIRIEVNSPGGFVEGTLDIVESMIQLKSPVHTHTSIRAEGAASFILIAGEKGHRSASPESWLGTFPISGSSPAGGPVMSQAQTAIEMRLESLFGEEVAIDRLLGKGGTVSPDEAIELGFIDTIEPSTPSEVTSD